MKCKGCQRGQFGYQLAFGILDCLALPRRKNSACKNFYQHVLVPFPSDRHKLGRQNAQDGSSVKKKKVCSMSMESLQLLKSRICVVNA